MKSFGMIFVVLATVTCEATADPRGAQGLRNNPAPLNVEFWRPLKAACGREFNQYCLHTIDITAMRACMKANYGVLSTTCKTALSKVSE